MANNAKLAVLGVLSVISLRCSRANLEHESWDSFALEEVTARLSEPTGQLSMPPSADLLRQVENVLPALTESGRFVGYLAEIVSDISNGDHEAREMELPAAQPPPTNQDGTWGTSFYLRLACPGEALTPPFPFGPNGEARIDSPTLYGIDTTALQSGGEFLLSFDECQIGDLKLRARVPGRYVQNLYALGYTVPPEDDPDFPRRGLALDLDVDSIQSPVGFVGFGCGSSTTSCSSDIRVAAELEGPGGSHIVAFRLTDDFWNGSSLAVQLRAANGTAQCTATQTTSPLGPRETSLECGELGP